MRLLSPLAGNDKPIQNLRTIKRASSFQGCRKFKKQVEILIEIMLKFQGNLYIDST